MQCTPREGWLRVGPHRDSWHSRAVSFQMVIHPTWMGVSEHRGGSRQGSRGLAWEAVRHHVCHILLASQSQSQLRFKGKVNRFSFLKGEVTTSHRKKCAYTGRTVCHK